MLARVGQDDDDRPVRKHARDSGVVCVPTSRVHQFRDSPVPDVHSAAVAVVNLDWWLAPDVHQRRFELAAFGSAKEPPVVDRGYPPVNISRRAAHPVRALVSPVSVLKAGRPHAVSYTHLTLP